MVGWRPDGAWMDPSWRPGGQDGILASGWRLNGPFLAAGWRPGVLAADGGLMDPCWWLDGDGQASERGAVPSTQRGSNTHFFSRQNLIQN